MIEYCSPVTVDVSILCFICYILLCYDFDIAITLARSLFFKRL